MSKVGKPTLDKRLTCGYVLIMDANKQNLKDRCDRYFGMISTFEKGDEEGETRDWLIYRSPSGIPLYEIAIAKYQGGVWEVGSVAHLFSFKALYEATTYSR